MGRFRNSGIVSNACARPNRQSQTGLEIKKGDRSILELTPNYSGRREPETISIKRDSSLKVVNSDGDDGNSRLHPATFRMFRQASKMSHDFAARSPADTQKIHSHSRTLLECLHSVFHDVDVTPQTNLGREFIALAL